MTTLRPRTLSVPHGGLTVPRMLLLQLLKALLPGEADTSTRCLLPPSLPWLPLMTELYSAASGDMKAKSAGQSLEVGKKWERRCSLDRSPSVS